jgi:hypothetical protein
MNARPEQPIDPSAHRASASSREDGPEVNRPQSLLLPLGVWGSGAAPPRTPWARRARERASRVERALSVRGRIKAKGGRARERGESSERTWLRGLLRDRHASAHGEGGSYETVARASEASRASAHGKGGSYETVTRASRGSPRSRWGFGGAAPLPQAPRVPTGRASERAESSERSASGEFQRVSRTRERARRVERAHMAQGTT